MIVNYKNRVVDINKPVRVYRNLNKKCWSIKQGGKVVAHAKFLKLKDVVPIVNEKGRLKVLATRRKNVHAFLEGFICLDLQLVNPSAYSILYNPYLYSTFCIVRDGNIEYVKHIEAAILDNYGSVFGENVNATTNIRRNGGPKPSKRSGKGSN